MKKRSPYLENAALRIKNRKWLSYSSNIARRILAALEDNSEMSQKSIAESLGVSTQYINKVVKGQENLSLETIAKISDAIGVELITFPIYKDDFVTLNAKAFVQLIRESSSFTYYRQDKTAHLNSPDGRNVKNGEVVTFKNSNNLLKAV